MLLLKIRMIVSMEALVTMNCIFGDYNICHCVLSAIAVTVRLRHGFDIV